MFGYHYVMPFLCFKVKFKDQGQRTSSRSKVKVMCQDELSGTYWLISGAWLDKCLMSAEMTISVKFGAKHLLHIGGVWLCVCYQWAM